MAARADAARIGSAAHSAHGWTTGPAWWTAASVPYFGQPLSSVRVIAVQADRLGHTTLPALIQAADALDPSTLRTSAHTINLQPLIKAEPTLAAAAVAVQQVRSTISQLPAHTWLSAADSARTTFGTKLAALAGTLDGADRAARLVPPMLGADGPRHYFVGLENEAEARGLGGLPGAFAILTADNGTLSVGQFASDTALKGVRATVDLGPEFNARYSQDDPYGIYQDTDVSPHFPYAAQLWASMWQAKTGQHVDGAVALDPTTLSYLLQVAGPATLPGGRQVSAGNVVALTQQTQYQLYTDDAQRRAFLVELAGGVVKRLLGSGGNATALVKAADHAATERRLLVWSAHPGEETDLARTSLGGTLNADGRPFSAVTVVNSAGNKLDYYLGRSIAYRRTGCGAQRDVTVTVALTNNAPAGGLPAYVTIRNDHPPYPTKPGDTRLLANYYGSPGAQLTSMTLDGVAARPVAGTELGLPVWSLDVELPQGTTRTLVLHLREPAGDGSVMVLEQPLVRAAQYTIDDAVCR